MKIGASLPVCGYTLIEVLLVVAMASALAGIAVAYKMNDAAAQLAEMEFLERYEKAENILVYGQNLHAQGFRSTTELNINQLKAATQGNDWEESARKISLLTADHADGDFKIRVNEKDIQLRFLIADEVSVNAYPLQRHRIAGDQDEVVLSRAVRPKRSRILRLNDYLMKR